MLSCVSVAMSWRLCSPLSISRCRFYYVSHQLLTKDVKTITKSISSSTSQRRANQTVSFKHKAKRTFLWMGGYYTKRSILSRSVYSLYKQCIDEVDYESFIKECQMPDTFHSWFLIAELHLWLCLVRLAREDNDGKYIIKEMGELFWQDVEERMKLVGVNESGTKYNTMKMLGNDFRGLVLAFEEGLLTDDRRLAAAIWRNFISDKTNTDFIIVTRMVEYIRAQVQEMDITESDAMLTTGKMNMLPLSLKCSQSNI